MRTPDSNLENNPFDSQSTDATIKEEKNATLEPNLIQQLEERLESGDKEGIKAIFVQITSTTTKNPQLTCEALRLCSQHEYFNYAERDVTILIANMLFNELGGIVTGSDLVKFVRHTKWDNVVFGLMYDAIKTMTEKNVASEPDQPIKG